MSLPASLLLKYNWPITLCQFLACNLVIPYFCRLQNDHHDKSSYHLLPYYWLYSHTVHFITVKVFLKLSMYFFFYTHNGVAHLQYRVSRTFICTGKPLPPPKNKQTNKLRDSIYCSIHLAAAGFDADSSRPSSRNAGSYHLAMGGTGDGGARAEVGGEVGLPLG